MVLESEGGTSCASVVLVGVGEGAMACVEDVDSAEDAGEEGDTVCAVVTAAESVGQRM